jgi:DNA-directed RNA polymerase sigma subunit (sigma70/sigma32)
MNSSPATVKLPKMPSTKSKEKTDRILNGLRTLCAQQPPGHTYSTVEIAAACGCSPENIGQIEKQALERVRVKSAALFREFDLELPARRRSRDAA